MTMNIKETPKRQGGCSRANGGGFICTRGPLSDEDIKKIEESVQSMKRMAAEEDFEKREMKES